jgi:ADP-ribosylglycohydrolase
MDKEPVKSKQSKLSNLYTESPHQEDKIPSEDKYEGAIVFSAIGDALGWPTEFLQSNLRAARFELPINDFVAWEKKVGGRWWAYRDQINPGEYSDDTQLTLAIVRSISNEGDLEPDRFAYQELPLWLHYERGGGHSIKQAAKSLLMLKSNWLNNFSEEYRNAGANGAAMRNLPIALSHVSNKEKLISDSFLNAVITHGHPRAILGAILFGLSVQYILNAIDSPRPTIISYLLNNMDYINKVISLQPRIMNWSKNWGYIGPNDNGSFGYHFRLAEEEISKYFKSISKMQQKRDEDYYRLIGALNPSTKGSGLSTLSAAIYMYIKHGEDPKEAILRAVNLIGSDTDTIALFLGAMLGAEHGISAVPNYLREQIQDKEYLLRTARRLHAIVSHDLTKQSAIKQPLSRREAYLRIIGWEIGLHEMFWDELDKGATVDHPTLGRGVIINKEILKVEKEGYIARLIRVKFDCGQTCIFHSRVKGSYSVSNNLAPQLKETLDEYNKLSSLSTYSI